MTEQKDPIRCPRCKSPLARRRLEEAGVHTQVHQCPACDGQYFSSGRLEPIQDVVKVEPFAPRRVPPREEQLKPVICPSCGGTNTMDKVPSPRDKDVLMDVCRSCGGTWLDRGELEAIQKEGFLKFLVNTFSWMRNN